LFFSGEGIEDAGLLEDGRYAAVINRTSEGSSDKGTYAIINFEIQDESVEDIAMFIFLEHENQTWLNGQKKKFKKIIVAATGEGNLETLDDLLGKKVYAMIGREKSYKTGDIENVIKSVESFTGIEGGDMPF